EIIDQYCDLQDASTLAAQILAHDPGLVGFSCLTPNMGAVLEAVAELRRRAPGLPVVFGNTHAAVFSDRILRRGEADFVVLAEGEEPLLGLVEALEAGRLPEGVPGVGYVDPATGEPVIQPARRPTRPLDEVPWPDWSKIDLSRYDSHPMIAMDGVTLPIQGSRGCAYSCTFCAQDQVFQAVRRRSPANICDELEHHIERYGVTRFGFIDAYWPLSVRKGHEFLDELERRGLHRRITWVTETRVDKVDEGLLRRMAADGCRLIMYGIEFGSDEALASTRKHARTSQAEDAIRWTHEAGILTLGLYVIGMPGETEDSIRRTLAFARKLGTDIAKFNIAVPLPGSAFFEETIGSQRDSLDYDAFHSWFNPFASGRDLVWTPDGLDGRRLVRLQRQGMLRYYLRPRHVRQVLRRRAIKPADMALGGVALVGDAAGAWLQGLRRRAS
ncbi:MAG: radical SAM protein, partial [Deltaproteobacteria bacterium]